MTGSAELSFSPVDSKLFKLGLQGRRLAGITPLEIVSAVLSDVENRLPLSSVLLVKFVTNNSFLSAGDLSSMLAAIKLAMITAIDSADELGISYAHAAMICATELHSRN